MRKILCLFMASLLVALPMLGDVVYKRGSRGLGTDSFGLNGTTGTEQTLAAIYDPFYRFVPRKPLKTIYVSCNPVDDAGCDDADNGGDDREKAEGTADSATATTLVDATLTGPGDDFYNGMTIRIIAGTGVGQDVIITDFTDSTGTVTVADWIGPDPDATSQFVIFDQTLDGGDLPGGNDLYPGTRDRPLATIPNLDNYMDCFTRFVFDSRDEWAGATNMGVGLTDIDPACPAGMTDDIGILFTVTTPGNQAKWDGSHQTTAPAAANNGCMPVNETTATAWVAFEHIECFSWLEEGARPRGNSKFAGAWISFNDVRNDSAEIDTNHAWLTADTTTTFCFNCEGYVQSDTANQGTPVAPLEDSKSILIGQGRFTRYMNGVGGNTAAYLDCSDSVTIGHTFDFVTGNGATPQNLAVIVEAQDDSSECAAGSEITAYFARITSKSPEVNSQTNRAFSVGTGSNADGMTVTVRLYQSILYKGRHTLVLLDQEADDDTFLDFYARGVLIDNWSSGNIFALLSNDYCDSTRSTIDIANSAYDDDNIAAADWDLCNSNFYATYELALAADPADGIAAHWTNFFGSVENGTGDNSSVDLGGDGVDEISWDADDTAGNSDDRINLTCDPSSDCHEAMTEDYTIPFPFTVPAWALGGEGEMTEITLEGNGRDIGNE